MTDNGGVCATGDVSVGDWVAVGLRNKSTKTKKVYLGKAHVHCILYISYTLLAALAAISTDKQNDRKVSQTVGYSLEMFTLFQFFQVFRHQ
jgi:hypothetical protein